MPKHERSSEAKRQAGLRLRAAREALSIATHEALANAIGVSRTTLSNWENAINLPDPLAMTRLSRRFGVPMEWIYGGDARHAPFELGQQLIARATHLGAVINGAVATWPKAAAEPDMPHATAIPRKPVVGYLHERPARGEGAKRPRTE